MMSIKKLTVFFAFASIGVAMIITLSLLVSTRSMKKSAPIFSTGGSFKNIIMLIPDGCDDSVLSLARWYKNDALTVDTLKTGKVHPFMANSLMTDSAPGGTAYSSGQLTTDKFIAVGPRRNDLLSIFDGDNMFEAYAPIPTVLEKANFLGLSTGLVATSSVTHATPASFGAHVDSRFKEAQIAKQMAFNGIDVVMGGGRKNMLPAAACNVAKEGEPTGVRADCLNLEDELISRGYNICTTKEEMMNLENDKAGCSFASNHMSPDIDRQFFTPTEPSIAEMTEKSIELLSKNDDGFFLMVEGSQIDWAGHSNDVSV
jgi:alkaline phosphatase